MKGSNSTSWQPVASWYKKTVGHEGHFYHQQLILPKSLKLLNLKPQSSLLDLACGQGILSRTIPPVSHYLGIDLAGTLIKEAEKLNHNKNHTFFTADITKTLPTDKTDFSHAAIILAIQNLKKPESAIVNAAKHLKSGGLFLIVMNHPCFRIPRQSSWEIDKANKLQYRRVNRYLSPLKIPIVAKPSLGSQSSFTWSFHLPLSAYTKILSQKGFVIKEVEEWSSEKESVGKTAKMENRSRSEFPLFLALLCQKA